MTDTITFDAALESFINGCQKLVDDENLTFTTKIEKSPGGRKYIRICRADYTDAGEVISRSAHCFVDTTNGNVLKAAGWKSPAKGARGNVYDTYNGLNRMSWTGAGYNR